MTATATTPDVVGFYGELGHDLSKSSGTYSPTRCLTHPERHKNGDRSPSASIGQTSGVHICGGCGDRTSPWDMALRALGSRSAAWDLCVKYGLRTPRVTQDVRSGEATSSHFVTSWVTPRSEAELLRLLTAYRDGHVHAEPVEHHLPEEASEFEQRYAAIVALLLGLLRGGTLLLGRRTALKAMGLEATEANFSRIRRANERFADWGTFEVAKAERRPGMANGTTTFKALWEKKRPFREAPSDVSEHNDGGSPCDLRSKQPFVPRDVGQSRSPAQSRIAATATSSPTRGDATHIAESSPTSGFGLTWTLSRTGGRCQSDDVDVDDRAGSTTAAGAAWRRLQEMSA